MPELVERERLVAEKEALGLWLTGHPVDVNRAELDALVGGDLATILGPPKPSGGGQYGATKKNVLVGGLVGDFRKRGNRVSFKLEDRSGRLEVVLFEDVFERYRHLLSADQVVLVEGGLRYDDFLNDWSLRATRVEELSSARQRYASHVVVLWNQTSASGKPEFVSDLRSALSSSKDGSCQVSVEYRGTKAAARLSLGDDWRVKPTTELLEQLAGLVGEKGVKVVYPPGVAKSGGFGNGSSNYRSH